MNFIGVDLAWGERSGTGLCVLSPDEVVASARLHNLNDIADWISRYSSRDCLVAIDAPMIVRNQTGRRPCESLISRCFGRYEASAHSSNLANPSFKTGGRANELVRLLGLDTSPVFSTRSSVRRAIEVYPHTALVALFDLPTTLKYKAKRSRTVQSRLQAFEVCIELMESLSTAEPPLDLNGTRFWRDLTTEINCCATGAALDRAEDELDGYICAYTALYYWYHGLDRCRIVGDTSSGYIVTPVSSDQAKWLDREGSSIQSGLGSNRV